MIRRRHHHHGSPGAYRHEGRDYDDATYDEREESISASEDGRAGHQYVATWRSPGAWGGDDE